MGLSETLVWLACWLPNPAIEIDQTHCRLMSSIFCICLIRRAKASRARAQTPIPNGSRIKMRRVQLINLLSNTEPCSRELTNTASIALSTNYIIRTRHGAAKLNRGSVFSFHSAAPSMLVRDR